MKKKLFIFLALLILPITVLALTQDAYWAVDDASGDTCGSYCNLRGNELEATNNLAITKLYKYSGSGATTGRIYNGSNVATDLAGSCSFSGDVCTFTTEVNITNGTTFYVTDVGGTNYGLTTDVPGPRVVDTNLTFNGYAIVSGGILNVPVGHAIYSQVIRGIEYEILATAPPNTNPTITNIGNKQIYEDGVRTDVNFTIGDLEDIPTDLVVTATSSNTGLLPNANIFLSQPDTEMILNMTPLANQFGNTTVNVTVTDTGGLTNSTTFQFEVLPVNDAPIITNVTDKVMVENGVIIIPYNVTDIDNLYTELSYQVGFTNSTLFTNYTFTNNDGTAQNLTLTADALYGLSSVNLVVSDGDLQDSTVFDVTVNCNTTVRYNATYDLGEPPACYQVTASYDYLTDILNYSWHDFGGTVDNSWIYVYRTTGGTNQEINYETSNNVTGEWIFNYSANYPNDDFKVYGYMSDSNRTFLDGETDINVVYLNLNQGASLSTFFSKQDGLIYSLLIMVLFLTIGVASQSATMTLILSVLALFISSKFVLNVPSELLWVTGAVIIILIWFIAKLRVD